MLNCEHEVGGDKETKCVCGNIFWSPSIHKQRACITLCPDGCFDSTGKDLTDSGFKYFDAHVRGFILKGLRMS